MTLTSFTSAASGRPTAQPVGLCDLLDEIEDTISRDSAVSSVRFGVVISAVGRRSYGPLLLMLGLFALSPLTIVPGLTCLTAIVILVVAAQMALGASRPWLPRKLLEIKLPRRQLFAFVDRARPNAERIDDVLRPRLTFLCNRPCALLIAVCVAAAALITLPLSLIPFAPIAPSAAVLLFGLGMTTQDGLLLGAGVALTAGAAALTLPLLF